MATKCPNKTFKTDPNQEKSDWQVLVDALGEERAYAIFMVKEELPSLETIQGIIAIEEKNTPKEEKEDLTSKVDKVVEEIKEKPQPLNESVNTFFQVISKNLQELSFFVNKDIKGLFSSDITGNAINSLYDRLKSVKDKEELGLEFERKVRGFSNALEQFKGISQVLKEHIEQIKFDSENPQDNLREIYRYESLINDWKELLDYFGKQFKTSPITSKLIHDISYNVDKASQDLFEHKESNTIQEISKILLPVHSNIVRKINEKLKEWEKKKEENPALAKHFERRIEDEKAKLVKYTIDNKAVMDYLHGVKGDAPPLASIFEALMDSPDPITVSAMAEVKKAVEKAYSNTRDFEIDFNKTLTPLYKSAGFDKFNPEIFNKQFSQEDERISLNGTEYKELSLLQPFIGWQKKLDEFRKRKDEADKANDKELWDEINLEQKKWQRDYLYQELTEEGLKKFDLLEKDEIGRELSKRMREIWNEIEAIQYKHSSLTEPSPGTELADYEYDAIEELLSDYSKLSRLTDDSGKEKTGKELEIAKRAKEYRTINLEIYEYKDIPGKFDRAYQIQRDNTLAQYTEDSPEFKEVMDKWLKRNMRVVNSPEWYRIRKEAHLDLSEVSDYIKDKNPETAKKLQDFSDEWEFITDITKGERDNFNQIEGQNLSEGQIEEIKEAQDRLEKLKESIENYTGLSQDEWSELNTLELKRNLTTEELARLQDLITKREKLKLPEHLKNKYRNAMKVLSEIQIRIPTEYYINELNVVSKPLGYEFGITDDVGIKEAESLLKPENRALLEELLKDNTFKTWFNKNHYKTKKFNVETQSREEVWARIYPWNQIVPTDDKYREKTNLSTGEVLDGKPALKYYFRAIKDKYKTEKVVGKTIDNKGNWLPKTVEEGAKDNSFYNPAYYSLIKDKNKENILNAYKDYLLKAQESKEGGYGIGRADKLYLKIPKVQRDLLATLKTKNPEAIKAEIKSMVWRSKADQDRELENVKKQQVLTDLFGKEIVDIPVKFTGRVPVESISLNIPNNIVQYFETAEQKRVLKEVHPLIKSLEEILESYSFIHTDKEAKNKYLKALGSFGKTIENIYKRETPVGVKANPADYQRLQNVRNIEEQFFKGEFNKYFTRGTQPIEETIDFLMRKSLGIFSFSILAFDYTGAVVNQNAAKFYQLFEGVWGRAYTVSDWRFSEKYFFKNVYPDLLKDLRTVENKSFHGQLIDLIDPKQDFRTFLGEIAGKETKEKWLEKAAVLFLNPREFGEFQIATTVMLSILKNKQVTLESGKKIPVLEAFKLNENNKITLRDDITDFTLEDLPKLKEDIRQTLRETQGNYAKIDKTQLERYTLGRVFFFMRRWLIPNIVDTFGGERFNYSRGWKQGFIPQAGKALYEITLASLETKTLNFQTASAEEKRALQRATIWFTSWILLNLLANALSPDGDPDKDKKYKALRKLPVPQLWLLYILLRTQSEIASLNPIESFNDWIKIISNPLIWSRGLENLNAVRKAIWNDVKQGFTDEDITHYSQKGGWSQRYIDTYGTNRKDLVTLYKLLGWKGTLNNPANVVQSYSAAQNKR